MVILCGVDDSGPARQAARAAAALARRAKEDLQLLHVQDTLLLNIAVEPDGTGAIPSASLDLLDAERTSTEAALEPLRAELAREFGLSVGLEFGFGFAENELARRARDLEASLIVLGAVGRRSGSMWRLGGVPDRLAAIAPVPLAVVREAESLARWALESKPLRVVVALDADPCSARAADGAAELARLGPCEIVQVHVYDPRREARRLGLARADEADTLLAIERSLARELQERSEHAVLGQARFVALPAHGHVAEALAEFAERERADLVIVGSHGRGAIGQRFLGSVSYGLLGLSGANMLLARKREARAAAQAPRTATSIRSVLAATDLSETGNRAVEHALALTPPGGQLTLLHVLVRPMSSEMLAVPVPVVRSREELRMDCALAQAELRKLIVNQPAGVEVEVEAVDAQDVTQAILQAAERCAADLVVLGRHGRSGLAAALLGSSVRGVVQRCRRPVLIVPDVSERA